jgi:hypothetical protein
MANAGDSPCRLRYHCAEILVRHSFAVWLIFDTAMSELIDLVRESAPD